MNKNQQEKLCVLVEEKSKEINITAIRDFDGIWNKHVLDSLEILQLPMVKDRFEAGVKVLDLGTGAGFPGLPLAIEFPQSQFTLLDGTKKKVNVVAEFVRELGLDNVETKWGRAEELSKDSDYEEKFDLVLARSVAYMPELIALAKPFVSEGGFMCFYKTYNEEEASLAKEIAYEHKYKIEGDDKERVILVLAV